MQILFANKILYYWSIDTFATYKLDGLEKGRLGRDVPPQGF